jgi:hypothetical protein
MFLGVAQASVTCAEILAGGRLLPKRQPRHIPRQLYGCDADTNHASGAADPVLKGLFRDAA